MEFTFTVNQEGIRQIEENQDHLYPNVEYNKDVSTVTLELPEPNLCTVGQLMTTINRKGLLVGKKYGELLILESSNITQYPYEMEAFQ